MRVWGGGCWIPMNLKAAGKKLSTRFGRFFFEISLIAKKMYVLYRTEQAHKVLGP